MSFREYVNHGWALCPIREGEKRPRGDAWNTRERAVTNPTLAGHLFNAGLLHAFSGTCAIDIDNYDLARAWLHEHGIDLDALFRADDAVQIVSGDASRGKLIYALPEPLPTKQIKDASKTIMLLEFRCSASTGNSAQDVLPPSTNPRTGKQYAWKYNNDLVGDWRAPPPLPESLHKLWLSLHGPKVERSAIELQPTAETDELMRLIANLNPDCSYDEWCKVGMILHHETGGNDDGLAVWNDWSSKGDKYVSIDDLTTHWNSFGNAANPATAGSLRREQVASDADFGAPPNQDLLAAAEAHTRATQLAQFTWRKLGEYKNLPPTKELIKGVLPEAPLSMMFGASGIGKSLVALDMGLAIVRSEQWRGLKTIQGSVGWLAAEAEGSMRIRSRAYEKGHMGIVVDDLDFFVLGEGIDLASRDTVKTIAASAPKGLMLIIVDTLAAASGSANENTKEDMNPVLDNCKLINAITGASILLIHHSGKDEAKGSRGWSGIKARMQAEIEIRKRSDSELRDIVITKQRDGAEGTIGVFTVAVAPVDMDEDGTITTGAYVKHLDVAPVSIRKGQGKWHQAIRRALAESPAMELSAESLEIAAVANVPESERSSNPYKRVREALQQMVKQGELLEPGLAGVGAQTYRFAMPTTISLQPDGLQPDADADLL